MQVSNDTPALNYVEYFTKQLPVDLANMAMLRDELAVRQGALSAAQDAVADREVAKQELAKARETAAAIMADAKTVVDAANITLSNAKAKEIEVVALDKTVNAVLATRESDVAKREKAADTKAASLASQQADLDKRAATLADQESSLQARVKAFQDKVAALSA